MFWHVFNFLSLAKSKMTLNDIASLSFHLYQLVDFLLIGIETFLPPSSQEFCFLQLKTNTSLSLWNPSEELYDCNKCHEGRWITKPNEWIQPFIKALSAWSQEEMVTYCFVKKTTRSHGRPRVKSLTGCNVGAHYLNEATPVYVTGRISPLHSLSNSSLKELEILCGERTGGIKAMTSDLFHWLLLFL